MSITLDLSGLDKRLQQLSQLKNNPNMSLNATTLMKTWMDIIIEDNRRGVLAGTDKDGVAMQRVTYRPKPAPGLRANKPPKARTTTGVHGVFKNVQKAAISSQNKEIKAQQAFLAKIRRGEKATAKQGHFAGLGSYTTAGHNNLTSAHYRLLAGPPPAPRDQFSRVITNLKPTFGGPMTGSVNWFAEGAWDQVVNTKEQPFLMYHFHTEGTPGAASRLPRRDLRGVRPQGIQKALAALRAWAKDAIRTLFD